MKTLAFLTLLIAAGCSSPSAPSSNTSQTGMLGTWRDARDSIVLNVASATSASVTFLGSNRDNDYGATGIYPAIFTQPMTDTQIVLNWQAPSNVGVTQWVLRLTLASDTLAGAGGVDLMGTSDATWDWTFTR